MNDSHLIITNRSAATADGWIHIVPKGELPNRAAGLVQVLDDVALDSILAGIAADAARLGNKWPGIYAGREHFIYNDEQDSAALAWFKEFEKRADGIWAKADGLTPIGKQVLANGEYKFTSFVADRKDTEIISSSSSSSSSSTPQRVRILKIDTVGFTNQANGKELLTPITNRETSRLATVSRREWTATLPGSREPGASQNHNKERTKTMKNIAQKLGLAPEASEDAILGEVIKLQNRLTTLEPLSAENETLKNRITAFDGEQVDSLLALHGVKEEKLVNRLKPVLAAMANRADRVAALLDFGFKPAEAAKPAPAAGRMLNRADGKPADEAPPGNEQELAAKAEAEINSYRLTNRCTYGAARNAVRAQKPELFGLTK